MLNVGGADTEPVIRKALAVGANDAIRVNAEPTDASLIANEIAAVAKDGGDIKFKDFKDGIVRVQLQGSCSGCPSSTMTLKQGVQNLLKHYIKEVKEVEAVQ